ncbi:MAG: MBL fold metallo-hydrolase [Verrucomicrobiota bacterium JB022]|nr:MBL fold metallo-hydrolase [Verrucomicrobiota bacterium JB022]
MDIAFLGTGTSQGVPMIAHHSHGLDVQDARNWRTRTSAHIWMGGQRIQIDVGPEFRLQCLRNGIDQVDYVLMTHAHADHIMGMDDLRRHVDLRGGKALPVYGNRETLDRLQQVFPYAMHEEAPVPGYPAFSLREMPATLDLPCGRISATPLPHGRSDTLGLVFTEKQTGQRLAYFTDCKEVTPAAKALAQGAEVLVIDALRPDPHPSHLHLDGALKVALELQAHRTYFIHMTFAVDHESYSETLPDNVRLAYDGLKVNVGTLETTDAPPIWC